MNNVLNIIGEKLFLNCQIGVCGTLNIASFSEDLEGVSADRFFLKKFRWSVDNLSFSDWIDLTLLNLQQLNGNYIDILFLEFTYERGGTDTTGYLKFNDLKFNGELIVQVNDYSTSLESIFKDFINNDVATISNANNLLKKIYKRGILPSYIKRGEENDDDFILFWSTVCQYFSLFVSFCNLFDNILNEKSMLLEYLKQRGLKMPGEDITMSDLQYISNNFLDEIRQRGTLGAFLNKSHVYRDGSVKEVDGELFRLLNKNHYDEFLIEFFKKEHCGYYLDVSCANFNGTLLSAQLNKTRENTADFQDLNNFLILNSYPDSVTIENEDDKKVLQISPTEVGVGYNGIGIDLENIPAEFHQEHLIIVEHEIDYELSFSLRRSGSSTENLLKVGVLGFNLNNFYVPLTFVNSSDNIIENNFINLPLSQILKTEEWYHFRCILYSKYSLYNSDENLFGVNRLTFNKDTYKIFPYILLSSEEPERLLVHDWKLRPLIRGRNILEKQVGADFEEPYIKNPCFVQNPCSVLSWTKNNSQETDFDLENFVNEYLLPYQKTIYNIRLKPKTDDKQLLT